MRRWALVVSDFRREYRIGGAELSRISRDEFLLLLRGLSEHSRFLHAWDQEPKHIYDPGEIAAVRAAAQR